MSIRIAIPEPSTDTEYNQRSLPPYIAALHSAGATPILVPLHERPDRVARLLSTTQGALLPGSRFDADPQRYGEAPIPECNPADPARTAVDELLLQDAFNLHKPLLGICQGAQNLNVWRNGTLIQDLPSVLQTPVNHSPGRAVEEAHPIVITPGTRLSAIAASISDVPSTTRTLFNTIASLARGPHATKPAPLAIRSSLVTHQHSENRDWENEASGAQRVSLDAKSSPATGSPNSSAAQGAKRSPLSAQLVNSSHHQAIRIPGDNLRVAAVSPEDQVIEAVELASLEHWVVAVQWHPERTYTHSALSRALFAAFVRAAQAWQPRPIEESVTTA
jgi:gamma-glutamyl-gamma-aminobutyrate hydrolase PuuD